MQTNLRQLPLAEIEQRGAKFGNQRQIIPQVIQQHQMLRYLLHFLGAHGIHGGIHIHGNACLHQLRFHLIRNTLHHRQQNNNIPVVERCAGVALGIGGGLAHGALNIPGDELGLTDDRPLLLSYWGSLGAEVMNHKMVDFIAQECYDGTPFHHIHGAGRNYAWMTEEIKRRGLNLEGTGVEVREYIYDMPLVMAAADVVLCRAGASTISEITAIAKPAILVPSPNVTANHQEKNARVLSEQGAAVLMLERECTEKALFTQAEDLLREPKRRENMIRALNAMAVPDAGEKIYQTLMSLMK